MMGRALANTLVGSGAAKVRLSSPTSLFHVRYRYRLCGSAESGAMRRLCCFAMYSPERCCYAEAGTEDRVCCWARAGTERGRAVHQEQLKDAAEWSPLDAGHVTPYAPTPTCYALEAVWSRY
eukprot:508297-Rhodomonas_salina.1